MRKHTNVALFVPHIGCSHRCSFCNQYAISGQTKLLTPEDVRKSAQIALATGGAGGEIAFFGGSFTAIDTAYMCSLLEAAQPYLGEGGFSGIRCSTRPDAIDDGRLSLLKEYGVTVIELGAQSMDNRVLLLNERGHTAEDTRMASEKIHAYGFSLGLQMMTGLLGDTDGQTLQTARELIALRPQCVRIYPTVVLKNTRLETLWREGKYRPQTLSEATALCAKLLLLFHEADIPVIRLGLHSGGDTEAQMVAGPYHPAFRELCEGEIYLSRMQNELVSQPGGAYTVWVAPSEISKAVGQKRKNLLLLQKKGYACQVLPSPTLLPYQVRIEKQETAAHCGNRKG